MSTSKTTTETKMSTSTVRNLTVKWFTDLLMLLVWEHLSSVSHRIFPKIEIFKLQVRVKKLTNFYVQQIDNSLCMKWLSFWTFLVENRRKKRARLIVRKSAPARSLAFTQSVKKRNLCSKKNLFSVITSTNLEEKC